MRLVIALWVALVWPVVAFAQDPVPDARSVISRDVDFPGGDLAAIFDTTLDACEAACLANSQCTAFTFNQRSDSCFPKVDAGVVAPYEGAVSARILRTPEIVRQRAATRAAELGFLPSAAIAEARDLAARIGRLHSVDEFGARDLLDAAAQARNAGNLLSALRLTGAATALTDEPSHWLEYGRLARTVSGETSQETNRIRRSAVPAMLNAYLRAESPGIRATILNELALALEDRDEGRLSIPVLRLSMDLAPRRDTEAALDRAIGLYGFRVADTEVESDSATPRICALFSEPLVQAGVDYTPYVQLPDPRLAVSVDGAKLCVDGVAHGERYRVVLREGLPAESGEALARAVELTLYVRDRSPSVRFTSRSYVLPRMGEIAIPVETVNLDTVDLSLSRVSERNILRAIQEDLFASPLYAWQEEFFEDRIGTPFWAGTASVGGELNRDTLSRLPLTEALEGQPPGVYVLQASVPGADPYDQPPGTQWFVLSDMGITTMQGVDGLTVVVRSLGDASAVEGATVSLLSRANAVLGEAVTDAQGVASFAPGLARGTGAEAPGLVTVRNGETDLGFLSLTDPAYDLSDRGVEGREPAPPIDVFLTTDRGAYRAGETIWTTALMRDQQAAGLAGVPLTAVLTRPDGVEYSRMTSVNDLSGGHVFALPVAGSAPRGTWRIEVLADTDAEPLAATQVLVEDFLPERIDFEMVTAPAFRLGEPAEVAVQANYLFGPPAPGLPIEGNVLVLPRRAHDDWPGYIFGRYDAAIDARSNGFGFDNETGQDGAATIGFDLPDFPEDISQPMLARITMQVAEGSGRPVERRVDVPVLPDLPMIAIRPGFDGVVPEGGEARFSVIGLSPAVEPLPMEVTWTVNRVRRTYQWYQLFGDWSWEPTETRSRVATGTLTLDGGPAEIAVPVDWGRYEIVVERTNGAYVSASTDFYAGWYAPADAGATPDFLDVSLDAESYEIGDTATFRMVPRYAGTALVTVMTNRLVAMEVVELSEGENSITLPVTEEWGAGAYVSASVLRPMDVDQGRNPARALGLAYAGVAPGDRLLDVSLDWNGDLAPRGPLDVGVTVAGIAPGERAHVTLAAVDVGILNLTGFDAPDPEGHYFGQRKLGVELRDVYGRLIDGMNGAAGIVRSGGDSQAGMDRQAPPPTEELVAFFSGPVTVDASGRAEIGFELPAFNGTVRLMAVAWSPTGVGQASEDVIVRDPVVVTASVPRFLAPGDRSRLLLEVVHADGPAGQMELSITSDGLTVDAAATPGTFQLGEGERRDFEIGLSATAVGQHEITVTLTTPDGAVLTKDLSIPVMRNDPEVSRVSRLTLDPGATFTFDDQVFAGFSPGTGSAALSIGPLARFDAPGLLTTLDRYPYGCTEQLTSRAMPLLYFDEVASALGLVEERQVAQRINEAILEILGNQDANGAFGLWGPYSGDLWLDAYVTDFLSRARGRDFDVPEIAWTTAMDNLRNRVNYAPDFESGGQDIAYALMVLAREGAASVGDLRYYVDEKADAFTTPLASAQLGMALAYYGDQLRADIMFRQAMARIARLPPEPEGSVWRSDYGTQRRDVAAVLALAVEAGTDAVDPALLTGRLARAGERVSTQEAVWTLLAADALIDDLQTSGITIDGALPDGPLVRLREDRVEAAPVAIRNTGTAPTDLTVTSFGVPEDPLPAGGNGYAIERAYFSMEGAPVTAAEVEVGTRLVTVLTVTPFGRQDARLMVDDPLPAGFEIDNPNLLRGGDIRGLDWLDPVRGEAAEFRQDRFLAAVNYRSDAPFRLAYIVRAVSPGEFHHPAASVEDMYRPQMRARTDTGRLVITD
ncbi:alpha-2-macroglobulin family protein [Ponticoccus sp. SC2-23]|uniref:alpha-2-macroglobulin family protein n=1 Tax=Alexandriicola marinus TaxID=2081710 RepID=UPI000FDA332A|nr:alpha-2-macroglobulin family protein [Alexandriicola marinus]MBM1219932.1 alpha-2-macroglobulin family protein [Ponticoccus sp. SC6-9]MBM1224618.1 alpha-2-macroglobulin family protein [Ponticoccus sp. SC6-15]MBM1228131.1 alpha-2-macroglobulin family protein [Ponticoccus sp. SC6-38]MBM1234231.1 alpha-2-macroglobulin family protein [Ponticoccus sp. SC6-45]MBM1238633.1 alpha-2-macroglobulin family protein [Ponticoccus sp. SC6-49]MBM1242414.1 alpha-2-macroglobulin family protein [Ponticoccus s